MQELNIAGTGQESQRERAEDQGGIRIGFPNGATRPATSGFRCVWDDTPSTMAEQEIESIAVFPELRNGILRL
jgi:hypothetical protein